MRKIHQWASVGVLVSTLGCKSFLEKYFERANFPAHSAGAALNSRFRVLVRQCGVIPPDERPSEQDYNATNFLPRNFTFTNAELAEVPILLNQHTSRLFLYTFTDAERRRYLATPPEQRHELPELADDQVMTEQRDGAPSGLSADTPPGSTAGLPASRFRQTCTSYVGTQASAGVSFPVASMQAAVNAELSTGGRVAMVTGLFHSPYVDMLDEGGHKALYARLLLWSNYRRAPSLADGSTAALASFRGVVLMSATTRSSGTRGSIEASAGGSAGVLSGQARAAARYEVQSEYTDERFTTLVLRPDTATFRPLDTPAQIRDALRGAFDQSIDRHTDTPMTAGRPHRHSFTIVGVPSAACTGASWRVDGPTASIYAAPPAVTTTSQIDAASQFPSCTFAIQGVPSSSALAGAAMPPLSYALVSDATVTVAGTLVALSIQVQDLQFGVSPDPQVHPSVATFAPVQDPPGSPTVRYRWEVPLDIRDAANPIFRDDSHAITATVSPLNCGARTLPVTPQVIRVEASQQYQLVVSVDEAQRPPTGSLQSDACRMNVTVALPLTNNTTVSRTFPLIVNVPRPEAAPSLGDRQDAMEFVARVQSQREMVHRMREE